MTEQKFLIRSDEDYHEFNLAFCGRLMKQFKKLYFKINSKHSARIYAKCLHPNDCPEHFWMYYLVFEVNGKPHQITSIRNEAYDTLTRGLEASNYPSVEFYTIESHDKSKLLPVSEADA
jgi:hypothetical protein